ncbi:Signal transduction histidine kinase [Pseudobutyrivibrio sp. AR14]|uniref:sensor histidine kinase n=1 Tax=Pseudobutyrivibrio sp. AR14 TaxID=1520804 RepID=UPI0008881C15|nr:sensor histidine kinase [Pseudobutyrivibrio sp. AR14]SCY02724.1 Signal transduction histidine kinase [Pseudobutyrivibrio sp. AR14]
MNYRLKLIVSFALLISLAFGIGGTLLISSSYYSLLGEEESAIINEYETLQNNLMMINHFSSASSAQNMQELIDQMVERNMAHWQALSIKSSGETILESGDQSLILNYVNSTKEGTYSYVHINEGSSRRLLLYSKMSTKNDVLDLRASFDLSTSYKQWKSQLRMFWAIYVMVVILGVAVAILFANILTKRLQTLTNATKEIAGGNLSMRTGLRTDDEFEQLSRDFDIMADQLQENIQQLKEDVQRKENFMGAVAHELKTPLTSIIGYADLMRQGALESDDRLTAANYIYSEGQRLEKLSHKILDLLLMEKDTFTLRKISMRAFMEQILTTTYPLARKKNVNLVVSSDDVYIFIEPDLAKSLLYNLIDNAIKATPEGGKVKVVARAINGGCEFDISDTGCGIENKELAKITEAFYRVDKSRSRAQGGAGLGLTLCKRIVDLHNGNMVFTSKPGSGSRVVVQLFGNMSQEVDYEK